MTRVCSILCFLLLTTLLAILELGYCEMQINMGVSAESLSMIAMETMKPLDYESLAIQLIPYVKQRDLLSSQHTHSKKNHRYLCSTFIKWSPEVVDRLVFNIFESKKFCSWLIIVYDGDKIHNFYHRMMNSTGIQDDAVTANLMKQSLQLQYNQLSYRRNNESTDMSLRYPVDIIIANKNNKTKVFDELFTSHCDRYVKHYILPYFDINKNLSVFHNPCDFLRNNPIVGHLPYNKHLISKGSLFSLLLPYLPSFDFVWVLDGDMSFEGLNLTTFQVIHQCAFEQPPYVVQPLINIPTQFYRYLIKRHWEQQSNTLASTVGFIEIQAPLFHARYFEWYILSFVIPLVPAMHVLGADWGLDELFCTAAQEYMRTSPMIHEVNGLTPACAVITANMSLHHEDSGDIRKSVGSELKRELNFGLMKIVHKYFNSFAFNGLQYHVNPFNRGTNFYLINKLRNGCSIQ